jgi:hypothetical protein
MVQDVHVKSSPGLLWQNQHSTRRRLFSPAFKEETSKVLRLEHNFLLCWGLATSASGSEIPVKFWNVLLENDGDQLDRSCEKWRVLLRVQEERNVLHYNRNANWFGHTLRRNCPLKYNIKWKIGGIEMTERRGIWLKQLLNNLDGTRGYWKFKAGAIDRTVLRTRLGRDLS